MMRMLDLKNKDILVVGLGLSGYAAASFLAGKGHSVRVTDSGSDLIVRKRADELKAMGVYVETGGHTGDFCSEADVLVVSPGVPGDILPLVMAEEEKIPVIGELELGGMFCEAPIIAVTGTNGKSTVTELIGHILAGSGRKTFVRGNIGKPLCAETENIDGESVVVAEVSSFQLETIATFRPHIAVLLNISEDHYDRHGTMNEYRKQKFRIFENQKVADHAVLHESLRNDALSERIRSRKHIYGIEKGASGISAGNIVIDDGERQHVVMPATEVPLQGAHNLENTVCACLAAYLAGVDIAMIRNAVRGFKPLSHRFETIRRSGEVEYINDSKATNIDATKRALESVSKPVVLIAGGIDKGGDYT
ncbi:MAG: UDP-N-acetylmuramoyl-L-alanine--D-glutamate ligase, partial [Candidatus Omnitrophica bacterium]|nr:UDP-N-acetylmuramoyl-L-alanine--D-glutamate ligase [Candidatus Omnitrophota bacterium]